MISATVEQLQRNFPDYVRRVQAGEHVIIVEADKPVAELKPVEPSSAGPRPFGLAEDEFTVPPDFDAPLPDEILDPFDRT